MDNPDLPNFRGDSKQLHTEKVYVIPPTETENYLMPGGSGPKWERVFRRRTIRTEDQEIVDDECVIGMPADHATRKLPEKMRVKTELYYWPDTVNLREAREYMLKSTYSGKPGYEVRKWTRVDHDTLNFHTVEGATNITHGEDTPNIDSVYRRTTHDLNTNECIEDILMGGIPDQIAHRPIPGGIKRNTRTTLYYYEKGQARPHKSASPIGTDGKRSITFMKYDMKGFLVQCVDKYLEICMPKYNAPLKKADTPFLDESRPEHDENPIDLKGCREPDTQIGEGEMDIAAPAPKPKAKAKAKSAASSESKKPKVPLDGNPGVLGDTASAILMKILYAARMGRYDLIRPVARLASRVTRWTELCDQKLHRLVCYINSTLDLHMYAWVGDSISNVEVVLYCDADLSGDRTDGKSTTGCFLCLMGPNTFVPLAGLSKKQGSVATSTPEAEVVAVHHGVCRHGIPALDLWQTILKRKMMRVRVMEDNSACSRILVTGNNPSMRHINRTQRIDISWLNERFACGDYGFTECPSAYQASDIFTKHCVDAKYWNRNLMLIGMFKAGTIVDNGPIGVKATHAAAEYIAKNSKNQDLKEIAAAAAERIASTMNEDGYGNASVEYEQSTGDEGNPGGTLADTPRGNEKEQETNAAPASEDCKLNKLISSLRRSRVPIRLKKHYSDNGETNPDRVIVEFCCGEESRLGDLTRYSKGCRIIRITEELDATSDDGIYLASKGCTVRKALLFSSIPCTGGSSWTHVNKQHHSAWKKVRQAKAVYRQIWRAFEKVVEVAAACGALIAIEWPQGCTYWKEKKVKDLINRVGLKPVTFHGCQLGIESINPATEGMPIKKPWTIYTNCEGILKRFIKYQCDGSHEHAECRGVDAKNTENYSEKFVQLVHQGFSEGVL